MVETVLRTAPVAVLVREIVVFGTTAPVGSAMWPDIDPEACANILEGAHVMQRRRKKPHRTETLHLSSNLKAVGFVHAARGVFSR